jgi:hypothetical protein
VPHWAHALPGLLFLRDQRYELQKVFDPKVRASGRDRLEHTTRRYTGPGRRQAPKLATNIVKVDAILAPGRAALNELECLSA